jgi:hypothetical protein
MRDLVVRCIALGAMLAAPAAFAADAGAKSPPPSSSASASAPVSAAASAEPARSLPPGHPAVAADDDGEDADEASPHDHDPHDPHATPNGMFRPPPDGAIEDKNLPKGTIVVQIADADNKPIPQKTVTLGVLYNSVAKGESRKRLTADVDAQGLTRFSDLDVGAGVAYRVMVLEGGATFSAMPFQLPAAHGMRALLHVYPVDASIDKTILVTQATLHSEVKDDRIQIHEAYRIYNVGRTAWMPADVVIPLPAEFTAFSAQQGMSDIGVDAIPKRGIRLHGTFAPGQHVIEFQWQLPYTGDPEVRFDVGMPPHLASAQVRAPAGRQMTLEVDGFPGAQSHVDGAGQRLLITERDMMRDEKPLSTVHVKIGGLPTEGSAKILATLLAAGAMAIGLVFGTKKPFAPDSKAMRTKVLADIEGLEHAHRAGDIGPKTYERARRELMDALARTFALAPKKKSKKPRA